MLYPPISLFLLCCSASFVSAQSSSTPSSGHSTSLASASSALASASLSGSASASGSLSPTGSTTSLPSLSSASPCVANCLDTSIGQVGCNSVADVNCFCGNATRFVRDFTSCVSKQCVGDLASAETLAQLFCNVASPSVSLSFSPLPSTSSSSLPPSSSSSSLVTSGQSSVLSTVPVTITAPSSTSSGTSSASSSSASQSGGTGQSSGTTSTYEYPNILIAFVVSLGLGVLGVLH